GRCSDEPSDFAVGGRCVFALSCLIPMVALSFAPLSSSGQTPPIHEWSERHPPQSSSPPALADHAVGSGTDGTYIYSMYKRTTSTSECHFQFVKYEADGTFKAEARWPGADEPVGEYIPRAMKVVHT